MNLSKREYEALMYIAKGFSDKEIAKEMKISTRTVQAHIKNIINKMSARNRSHAVAIYYEDYPYWKSGRKFTVK